MEGFTQRQTIELTQSNPVLVRDQPLVKGDVQALVWIVTVKKNGVPVDLAGATASLYCARALSEDGSGGTTYSEATIESGGAVKAVLPTDAANIPGPVGCMIRVTRDGASVAVARMAVMAVDLTGDDILDEGKRIPSLDEIAASIARCDAAAEKAEGAAASVGDALKQVASAIEAANGAASDARNAAGQATDGASAAKAAATTAAEAATKIDDMTITATGLAAGAAPTAELIEAGGHYNIVLGLPKGDKGDPGATPQITVQVKTGEPGTAASVKQTGTAEAPVIELTIPRGDTGSLGNLTINGKAPDAAGKVELTAEDVGALSGTDATLTLAGKAADAKKVGTELSQLKTDIEKMYSTEVLWENAAPNSTFDAQTITFDWKNYEYYTIYFLAYVDTGLRMFSAVTKKGDRLRFYFLTDTTDGTAGQYRDFYSGESRFEKAIRLKDSSSDNQRACIPIRIYGVKGV